MTELRIVPRWTTYLPHILLIALLWSIAMTMDYHDEVAQAEEQAQQMSRQMAECLTGTYRATASDGVKIAWLTGITFNPETEKSSQ